MLRYLNVNCETYRIGNPIYSAVKLHRKLPNKKTTQTKSKITNELSYQRSYQMNYPLPSTYNAKFWGSTKTLWCIKNYLFWSYKQTYPKAHLFTFIDSTVKLGEPDFIYTLYKNLVNNTNYLGLEHSYLSCKIFTLTFTITNIRTPVRASRSILPSRPAA